MVSLVHLTRERRILSRLGLILINAKEDIASDRTIFFSIFLYAVAVKASIFISGKHVLSDPSFAKQSLNALSISLKFLFVFPVDDSPLNIKIELTSLKIKVLCERHFKCQFFYNFKASQCLSSYGICLSKQRVIAKLQAAGSDHDKTIIKMKGDIEERQKELLDIKKQMHTTSIKLQKDAIIAEIPREAKTHIIFVDEQDIQQIKAVGTSSSKTSKESLYAVTSRALEILSQESSQKHIEIFESFLNEKRETEKAMLASSYQIIGDDLDFYIKVKHIKVKHTQSSENQNRRA